MKITLTTALLVGGWTAFVLIGQSRWRLAAAVLLGIAFTRVAFLGHDVGHKQVFRTRRGSYLGGLLYANLAWWSRHRGGLLRRGSSARSASDPPGGQRRRRGASSLLLRATSGFALRMLRAVAERREQHGARPDRPY